MKSSQHVKFRNSLDLEASRFWCRKSIFNATKGTYSMYSCTISGMSREMMKMVAEIVPNIKSEK